MSPLRRRRCGMEESIEKDDKKRESALISYGWDGDCCEYFDDISGFII